MSHNDLNYLLGRAACEFGLTRIFGPLDFDPAAIREIEEGVSKKLYDVIFFDKEGNGVGTISITVPIGPSQGPLFGGFSLFEDRLLDIR
jgi:hypothetical protein